jgi:hypothetical protein
MSDRRPKYSHSLNDKFLLITKPEQSGKTFIMINKINEMLAIPEYPGQPRVVNFIFCDNSLLLNMQTLERLRTEIRVDNDTNMVCVEFSSSSSVKNKYKVRELIEDGVQNIICCTNGTRVRDVCYIINRMNNNGTFDNGPYRYSFNLWLDEADKYAKFIDKFFIPCTTKWSNVNCFMITATPRNLFKKYGDIRTLPIENTTSANYNGWSDNDIIIKDDQSRSTIGFAEKTITELLITNDICAGHKGYVPADFKKDAHYVMRDMLIDNGIATFVINGDGIELNLPNSSKTKIVLKKSEQLCDHIIQLYNKYNVKQWPCVITGNICISRGISIINPNFMLDFAILSETSNKTEASQKAGRVKGNIKHWDCYKPIKVYTTHKFNAIATEYESMSREIAVLAFRRLEPFDDVAKITYNEVKNVHINTQYYTDTKEFDTLYEATNFLKANNFTHRNITCDDEGFMLSSSSGHKQKLSYHTLKQELSTWSPISNLAINKTTGAGSRLYVCYKDLSDKNSVIFIVKIAIPRSSPQSIVYSDK